MTPYAWLYRLALDCLIGAWGRIDGTVVVADLPEVQRRLAELGLGW